MPYNIPKRLFTALLALIMSISPAPAEWETSPWFDKALNMDCNKRFDFI